jgi:MinD superfamily P-loop ATPase
MATNWYPVIDRETCDDCGKCVEKCSLGVFDKSSPKIPDIIFSDGCKYQCHGCGDLCPQGSITYFGENTGWTPPYKKTAV